MTYIFPKASPSDITLGARISAYEFWDTNIQIIAMLVKIHIKVMEKFLNLQSHPPFVIVHL